MKFVVEVGRQLPLKLLLYVRRRKQMIDQGGRIIIGYVNRVKVYCQLIALCSCNIFKSLSRRGDPGMYREGWEEKRDQRSW